MCAPKELGFASLDVPGLFGVFNGAGSAKDAVIAQAESTHVRRRLRNGFMVELISKISDLDLAQQRRYLSSNS